MREVDEIPVPGRGPATAVGALVLWGFAVVLLLSDATLVSQLPPWSPTAVMALGPIVLMFAAWSLVTRRVVVASPDGVRVTRWPLGIDAVWISRRDLVLVSIQERETDGDHEYSDDHRSTLRLWRPQTHWAVVAVTHHRGDVTLATGFSDAEVARQVAQRIRAATGC